MTRIYKKRILLWKKKLAELLVLRNLKMIELVGQFLKLRKYD